MHELTRSPLPELADYPKAVLGHVPTPLEFMPRLSECFPPHQLYVKRDDCTGLGFGGNKVRQLEYYLGDALSKGCDTVLSTGAIQSNFMRTLAAASSKLGLECHIQLEDRVPGKSELYYRSGNRMLSALFGAHISYCADGEDEAEADSKVRALSRTLAAAGRKPYVVPLKPVAKPKGALGYVDAASEIVSQCREGGINPDMLFVGSGSGITHSGLLLGLDLLDCKIPVIGACVRRPADQQKSRVYGHCKNLCKMMGKEGLIDAQDVQVTDCAYLPGYGQFSEAVLEAVELAATREGLLLDPVYSGKTLASLIAMLRSGKFSECKTVIFVHTGGAPALFAYQNEMNVH